MTRSPKRWSTVAKMSGLGRGLGALLGDVDGRVQGEASGAELRELPLAQIRPNPDQPRKVFDEDDLAELADSVAACGLLQPLVVRPVEDGYQIVAGERRYQASKRAGLVVVPALVREVSDDEVLQLALIENLQRRDLNPMEAARGYKALIERNGLTHEEVAQVLSKSRSSITNALRLLELPEPVQELVMDGKLTAGHARAILAVSGEDARIALAQKVVQEGLSVRQTEILGPLFSVKNDDHPPRPKPAPESYGLAARRLRKALGTKVRVRTVRGKNKVEIEFADEDALADLVDRLTGE